MNNSSTNGFGGEGPGPNVPTPKPAVKPDEKIPDPVTVSTANQRARATIGAGPWQSRLNPAYAPSPALQLS